MEPAVFGLVKLNPELFWPAMLVATAGNTLGGAISWWMGYGAEKAYERSPTKRSSARAALAGALRAQGLPAVLAARRGRPAVRRGRLAALPFWPCVAYMAIGKFAALRDDDGGAAVGVPRASSTGEMRHRVMDRRPPAASAQRTMRP
jgi:hypothetical protein